MLLWVAACSPNCSRDSLAVRARRLVESTCLARSEFFPCEEDSCLDKLHTAPMRIPLACFNAADVSVERYK